MFTFPRMRILVSLHRADSLVIDVKSQSTLRQFKRLCQEETGISSEDMILILDGRCLSDEGRTMRELGFRSGVRVMLEDMSASSTSSFSFSSSNPQRTHSYHVAPAKSPPAHKGFPHTVMQDPAQVRELLMSSPDQLALLKQNNPRLSEALHTGRIETFAKVGIIT